MREPEVLDFSSKDLGVETIEQFYFTVNPEQKYDLLVRLLEREKPARPSSSAHQAGHEKIHKRLSHKFDCVDTIHATCSRATAIA